MAKQYKNINFKKESGIVPLNNGYALIVPRNTDNKEIMVAIGTLVQVWGLAELEHGKIDIETFKKMLCAYADKYWTF